MKLIPLFFVFGIFLILSTNVFAYGNSGNGICECNSCIDCTKALNDNNNCSSTVKLNQSITNQAGSCIYNPLNWTNKIFDCQGNTIDGDKNRTYYNNKIPIVIEVFTRDGCPICYHVDEGAKKLADEYNEKNKNSVILLKYHLQDTLATQAGLDRRIFYHGDKWWNVCNYYELCAI